MNEFIKEIKEKPEIICAQETWLRPALDFVTKGLRRDRYSEVLEVTVGNGYLQHK